MLEEESTAGSSCWVGALSQLPEADCPSGDSQLFSFSLFFLLLHSHPFIDTWKQCWEVCFTCSRQSGRQTVLMKFLVPRESYISSSSFLARCGQETPPAEFYLSQLLFHSQHSAWLHLSLHWPFTVTLKSCKHCLPYHSAPTYQTATNNTFWVQHWLVVAPVWHSNNL